jgi:hypothetical protein
MVWPNGDFAISREQVLQLIRESYDQEDILELIECILLFLYDSLFYYFNSFLTYFQQLLISIILT